MRAEMRNKCAIEASTLKMARTPRPHLIVVNCYKIACGNAYVMAQPTKGHSADGPQLLIGNPKWTL